MRRAANIRLYVEFMEPQGLGALQLAFEQLKKKLAAEGLFDADRKKPLPKLPRTVGIITSPRGAAIQDMIRILQRRHESLHLAISCSSAGRGRGGGDGRGAALFPSRSSTRHAGGCGDPGARWRIARRSVGV